MPCLIPVMAQKKKQADKTTFDKLMHEESLRIQLRALIARYGASAVVEQLGQIVKPGAKL